MSLTQTIRDNRATVICGVVIALVLGGLFVWHKAAGSAQGTRLVALVHDGDGVVHELPLDTDATLTVTTSLGSNTLAVEDGAIRMLASDCPQRTCLQTAPLDAPGKQIICLPHQLWVEVVPEGSAGGELDVTRAEQPDDAIDLQAR